MALRNPRTKYSPIYVPNGIWDNSDTSRKIFMNEERYFPALSDGVTNWYTATLFEGTGSTTDPSTTPVVTTATAAELDNINRYVLNKRSPRALRFCTTTVATAGVATFVVTGIDQFGVRKQETHAIAANAVTGTDHYTWHCYQRIISITCSSLRYINSAHRNVYVRPSFFMGLGCKLDVLDQLKAAIAYTTPGTASTGITNISGDAKIFGDCVVGTRVLADGAKYSFYCGTVGGSGVDFLATSSYKLVVPCLNDQVYHVQENP